MTKRPSKQQPAARTDTPPAHDPRPGLDLRALRAPRGPWTLTASAPTNSASAART